MKQPYLMIACIKRAHGIQGEFYADVLTDDPERFYPGLHVAVFENDVPNENPDLEETIGSVRSGPSGLLLTFEGCGTREDAARYCGRYIAVRREDALPVREGSDYYAADLFGCEVHDRKHGFLGKVISIDGAGTAALLAVRSPGKQDILIPFKKAFISKIDMDASGIETDLPPGLYELYRPEEKE